MKFGEDINIEDAQLHMIQEMAKEFKMLIIKNGQIEKKSKIELSQILQFN